MTNSNKNTKQYKYFRIVLTGNNGKSHAIYLYDVNVSSILERIKSIYDQDFEITRLTILDELDTKF